MDLDEEAEAEAAAGGAGAASGGGSGGASCGPAAAAPAVLAVQDTPSKDQRMVSGGCCTGMRARGEGARVLYGMVVMRGVLYGGARRGGCKYQPKQNKTQCKREGEHGRGAKPAEHRQRRHLWTV